MVESILSPVLQSILNYSDKKAFFIGGTYYTYLQFAERTASTRLCIQEAQDTDKIWALAIHDDIDTYAAIFALWMEGKAYVPLHPNQPVERNISILDQVGIHHILDSQNTSVYSSSSSFVLHCTSNKRAPSNVLGSPLLTNWAPASRDDLAYILFTSGSTGTPKGVQITRRNIATFMDSLWKTGIKVTQNDRCLQAFDLTFDVSIQSFLVALTRGACLYTVPYGQVKYVYVASLIHEQHITFGAMAPSMLTYLRPYYGELDASSLCTCILTAEACPIELLDSWYNCAINAELYDFYGPTETTIYCTYYKLERGGDNLSLNGIVSIGKPFANVHAIIIREDGSLVDGQEKGELCIAGDQVSPGYWNDSMKNDSSFFIHDGQRFYHTGDLCYWDPSGNIMYSGRIDQQAKIQGYRVELGEIEHFARSFYNNQHRVVAITYTGEHNLTEIALFIESNPVLTKPLLDFLRSKMPSYMIPTHIFYIPDLPINNSDKIDRNALKQMIL